MRARSVAIVSDGSMLDSEGKKFMPVMDWFITQIKYYSGYDAFPFVIRKGTNLSNLLSDLSTTYSTVLYLDNLEIEEIPKNILLLKQQIIVKLSSSSLTNAEATAKSITYLNRKKIKGHPNEQQYMESLKETLVKREEPKITPFSC
jgi:hypothetical protein